tara:strand:+ start:1107 stop:1625 length:519 start_codon:yes stop_codon:yes gene_type:complete
MHAKQVADMLVTAGYSFASSSKKVVVVPMAYDYGEWDRGRQRLAAEIAMDHGAGSSTGRTVSHVADPASKKVRHRFLFCVLPQQAKLQHGLRTVLAVFPVVRKQVMIPPTLHAHACMRTPMHAGILTSRWCESDPRRVAGGRLDAADAAAGRPQARGAGAFTPPFRCVCPSL